METVEKKKKPRPRRSYTPEFKAEIVEVCQLEHVDGWRVGQGVWSGCLVVGRPCRCPVPGHRGGRLGSGRLRSGLRLRSVCGFGVEELQGFSGHGGPAVLRTNCYRARR